MHRLETSTVQVNAALAYCQEQKTNIFGPVRHIGRAFIKEMKMTKQHAPNKKKPINLQRIKNLFQEAKKNVLSRFA